MSAAIDQVMELPVPQQYQRPHRHPPTEPQSLSPIKNLQKQSSFCILPAEVRTMVYKQLFKDAIVHGNRRCSMQDRHYSNRSHAHHRPPIARGNIMFTCHFIFREARPLFYNLALFKLSDVVTPHMLKDNFGANEVLVTRVEYKGHIHADVVECLDKRFTSLLKLDLHLISFLGEFSVAVQDLSFESITSITWDGDDFWTEFVRREVEARMFSDTDEVSADTVLKKRAAVGDRSGKTTTIHLPLSFMNSRHGSSDKILYLMGIYDIYEGVLRVYEESTGEVFECRQKH